MTRTERRMSTLLEILWDWACGLYLGFYGWWKRTGELKLWLVTAVVAVFPDAVAVGAAGTGEAATFVFVLVFVSSSISEDGKPNSSASIFSLMLRWMHFS